MKHNEVYKQRVNTLQRRILTVQLCIMVLGGAIFLLGVVCRPILRITRLEHVQHVKQIVNLMVGAGLVQIVAAAYDIFSGCWKLIYPIYLGIGGTTMTVVLELIAIGSSLYLYTRSSLVVNEDRMTMHPWFWVECLNTSCHERMLSYIHWYILPQVALAGFSIFLQCVSITLLAKLVRTIADHVRILHEAQEKYHDEWEEKQFQKNQDRSTAPPKSIETSPAHSTDDVLKTPPRRVQFQDVVDTESLGSAKRRRPGSSRNAGKSENLEMMPHTSTYEAQIHATIEVATPCSILKGDHGYVRGSRVSLDYDNP